MAGICIQPEVRPLFPLSRSECSRVLETIVHSFGWRNAGIEVEITSDQALAGMNETYLGLPGPTNVLSFPLDADPESGLNGCIVLSAHAVQREAFLYAQNVTRHCLRLLVHAVLHLAGLEHGPEMEAMTESGLEAAWNQVA